MKTLLLTATLIAATGAVATVAAADVAVPPQNPFAVASSPYERLTQTARDQFAAKDFVGAQKTAERALELAQTDKEKSNALLDLGQALNGQQKYAEARETYQSMAPLLRDAPSDLATLNVLIAVTYFNQENWQKAADDLVKVIDNPLTESRGVLRSPLAISYINLKQPDKAREQLAIIAADETMPADLRGNAQFTIGKNYLDEGKLDEARKNIEAAAKIPGVSGEIFIGVYDTLGLIARKQGRTADAKQGFDNARNLYMQKAKGQFDAKDFDGAIVSYKAALGIDMPNSPIDLVAHQQIGTALQSQEKYDEARAEYQFIIDTEVDPADANQMQMLPLVKPGAYIGIANGYIAQKQFDKAREALDKMLAMPNLLAPFRMSAEALIKKLPQQTDAPARN